MERFINYSSYSISCHSGFLVQVAGANTSKIIDIINNNDYKWYSCWKPKNTVHKFVFKSTVNKISLTIILKSILSIINKGD
jgi:predicted nucleic-acid-binding Zn-ribbon protein